jgi:hypothetical protein
MRFAALTCLLASASCVSVQYYAAPPDLNPTNAATVVGTRIENSSILASDTRGYLTKIDGVLTGSGSQGWDKRVLIAEGHRTLTVGVATSSTTFGFAEISAKLAAGRVYTIQVEKLAELAAQTWLTDQDGNAATERSFVRIYVARPAYVPIIVPVR